MVNPNLLSITANQVLLKYNIQDGKLSKPDEPIIPSIHGELKKANFNIETQDSQIKIDTYAARSSIGFGNYNFKDFNTNLAQSSKQKALSGVARRADEGDQLAAGTTPAQIVINEVRQKAARNLQTRMDWYPKHGADITASKPQYSAEIGKDEIKTSWKGTNIAKMKFERGSVDIKMEGDPGVTIEYIGDPIYVPPSANPNVD